MEIIDSHSHLNDDMLTGSIPEIKERMRELNVLRCLIPAWDINSSKKAIEIAETDDSFYAAVGFQPQNIDEFELSDIETIKELSYNKNVVAIGEIGLDLHYTKDTLEKQKEFLIREYEVAMERRLPVIIHMRDATEEFITVTRDFMKSHNIKEMHGVLHSFSGSVETMNILMNMGFYISFSGPVTFKNARVQKESALSCPLNRILVETDSPYLSPEPFRGKINEPKNTYYTLKYICELKGISEEELAEATTKNFTDLFLSEETIWD